MSDDLPTGTTQADVDDYGQMAPYPACMAPDGAEPCPQYTALLDRISELEKIETLAMLLCNCFYQSVQDIEPPMDRLYEALQAALRPQEPTS